ncbi:MAG TPA: hypothetical protein VMA98_11975 [Candidatus Acidoferrales bacterium]|nr:hypothetical protein [Candidatus Acidoferrales bacterium]
MHWLRRACFVLASAALMVSCAHVEYFSLPPPSLPPSSPGTLTASPAALAISGTGAGYAQTTQVQETGYTGTLGESNTCSGVATISPSSASGPSATFTVTGSAPGSCTATISGGNSQQVTVTITVTTIGVGVQ